MTVISGLATEVHARVVFVSVASWSRQGVAGTEDFLVPLLTIICLALPFRATGSLRWLACVLFTITCCLHKVLVRFG